MLIILMLMEHAERADEAMDVIAAGGGPAGLMTAALLDAAGVRAEACERGSEPTRQSRGTARHPRTLEVLTMIDAGDGRRISDVLLAQGRRVPGHAPRRDARPARLPRPGHAVPVHADAPAVGAGHALAVYLDARGVPVRHGAEVTAAGEYADEARVQVIGGWHTARYLVGSDGAHSTVRKAAGIGCHGGVPDPVGWIGDVQLAGPVERARHHWHQEPGHANVVPLGGSAPRVYGTHAGDSQLAAGRARPAGRAVRHAGAARSPSRVTRTSNTGRRDAANPAWNCLPRAPSARTPMQRTASRPHPAAN